MKTRFIPVVAIIILLTPAVWSQDVETPDITGSWRLTASAQLADLNMGVVPSGEVAPICFFSGTAFVNSQQGSEFSGTASLNLDSGPDGCPAELFANIQGTLSGNTIEMAMLLGGDLGEGSFTGTLFQQMPTAAGAEAAKAAAVPPGRGVSGSFSIQSGPFMGVTGTFGGGLRESLSGIPTLGNIGLLVLALLLAAIGWTALARTRKTA